MPTRTCACGCGEPITPGRKVKNGHARRRFLHRNILIKCRCGCGQTRHKYDEKGRIRYYIIGHSQKGVPKSPKWRRRMSRLKMKPRSSNPWIDCGCGCGKKLRKYDSKWRPRKYLPGHSGRGKKQTLEWIRKRALSITGPKHPYWNPNREEVGRVGQNFTPSQRQRLLAKSCKWCGSKSSLVLDHILPIFAGGTNDDANAQTLCRSCNETKKRLDRERYAKFEPLKRIPYVNWMGNKKSNREGYIPAGETNKGPLYRRPTTRLLAVELHCDQCQRK